MGRMSWIDGWHLINDKFSIYIEGGRIKRGIVKSKSVFVTVYPYKSDKRGGFDFVEVVANKRNFEKLFFF